MTSDSTATFTEGALIDLTYNNSNERGIDRRGGTQATRLTPQEHLLDGPQAGL